MAQIVTLFRNVYVLSITNPHNSQIKTYIIYQNYLYIINMKIWINELWYFVRKKIREVNIMVCKFGTALKNARRKPDLKKVSGKSKILINTLVNIYMQLLYRINHIKLWRKQRVAKIKKFDTVKSWTWWMNTYSFSWCCWPHISQ